MMNAPLRPDVGTPPETAVAETNKAQTRALDFY